MQSYAEFVKTLGVIALKREKKDLQSRLERWNRMSESKGKELQIELLNDRLSIVNESLQSKLSESN